MSQNLHLTRDREILPAISSGTFALCAMLLFSACKNVVRTDAHPGQAPQHPLDFRVVKYTSYRGDQVLSSGQYLGHTTRSAVIDKANSELRIRSNCALGSQRDFCDPQDTAPVTWIQLFLPDGSSCGVGKVPQGVAIKLCMDKS